MLLDAVLRAEGQAHAGLVFVLKDQMHGRETQLIGALVRFLASWLGSRGEGGRAQLHRAAVTPGESAAPGVLSKSPSLSASPAAVDAAGEGFFPFALPWR